MTMIHAAAAFLESLRPEQRDRALIAFEDDERFDWHFIPKIRRGLPLKEMDTEQRATAMALLKEGLSEAGMRKAGTIRQLELVLLEIEQRSGPIRDPELYYFTVFGTPSADKPWGWRYEGHHCSQHWTMVAGKPIVSLPQFFGANPAEVRHGPMKGTRVLSQEEDLARSLLHSMDASQRERAIISTEVPPDIITGPVRQAAMLERRGLPYLSLTSPQQSLLIRLLEEYAGAQPAARARERLDRVRHDGLDELVFAWMGAVERGAGHYYRLQGHRFVIEYDNTQNDANHIHTVWRDLDHDFGLDFLADHYHHHRHSPAG